MYLWLLIPLAYVVGSINGGSIISRFWKVDIRSQGSGNVGTTNVLRTVGPIAAIVVLFIDVCKGMLVVYLSRWAGADTFICLSAALAVVVGHNWPIYFGFKGGKGIATSFGVLIAISPWLILVLLAEMLILVAITRYVSLGSIAGALILPFYFAFRGYGIEYIIFAIILSSLAIYRHRSNIVRLWKGEELKLGRRTGGK